MEGIKKDSTFGRDGKVAKCTTVLTAEPTVPET
jgi:hypothetical protein